MLRSAMSVLRLFTEDRQELGMAEASRLLGRAPTTVSRWLRSMAEAGVLDRDPESGRYRIGRSLIAICGSAERGDPLRRAARRAVERLSAATGETAYAGVLQGTEALLIDGVMSPRPIRLAYTVGDHVALHASATGRCLLAWLPESRIRELVSEPLPAATAYTVTGMDRLLAELAATRERGYAIARSEWEEDLAAAAAPIRDVRGDVVVAVSVGGPVSRIDDARLDSLGCLAVVYADLATAELRGVESGAGPGESGR